MDTNKIEKWFSNYTNKIIEENNEGVENLELKRKHCYKVRDEAVVIAESAGLDKEDTDLARIIGLLHDTGRFEQYAKYNTFVDAKSKNHALLGIKIITQQEVLNGLAPELTGIIYSAIENHNRAAIYNNLPQRAELHSRIIRDADKLDIWRIVTNVYLDDTISNKKTINLDLPDIPEISDKVYEAVMSGKIIKSADLQTVNDFRLLQIAWLYDLNFKKTAQLLVQREYIDLLFSVLPVTEKTTCLRKKINNDLQKILKYS